MTLAERVKRMAPSPTMAIDARARELRSQGIDVISFGVGEPDFPTPENIKQAAIKAINSNFTKYTAASGTIELKSAVVEKLKRDNGLIYNNSDIVISCGAKHSLFNIAATLFDKGDEVLIPAPFWVSYPEQVKLVDAIPVFVKTEEKDNFQLRGANIKNVLTEKTKAIILNSPCNPTGSVYGIDCLKEVAELALKHNFWVISDECYEALVYNGEKHISIASLGEEIKSRTIVVNAVSKAYSMTGWRIGYAVGPSNIMKAIGDLQSQCTSNPTSIAQKAAEEALRGPQDTVYSMVAEFDKRRKYIVKRLNSIKGISCINPKGAFYAFPNISGVCGKSCDGKKLVGSSDVAAFLLEKARVAVVAGLDFGSDAHIRLSYATSMENIEKGLDRIEEAINSLQD